MAVANVTAGSSIGVRWSRHWGAKPCRGRQPLVIPQSTPKRMMYSPTVFPGEDAPGTGKFSGWTPLGTVSMKLCLPDTADMELL